MLTLHNAEIVQDEDDKDVILVNDSSILMYLLQSRGIAKEVTLTNDGSILANNYVYIHTYTADSETPGAAMGS